VIPRLFVADDMGKVNRRGGRTARALRTIVAWPVPGGPRTIVEIVAVAGRRSSMAGRRDATSPRPGLVAGKVTRAHGLRGEVTVLVFSEVESRFEPGSVLHLEDGVR